MRSTWDLFYSHLMKDEGTKYEDDPDDSGGPTKCGVTIADVARWNEVHLPARGEGDWDILVAKVKALTPESAAPIYKRYYWDEVLADELPAGVDYCVVDYGVNSGVGRSKPTLEDLTGATPYDAAIKALDQLVIADVINAYQNTRRDYLISISEPGHKNHKFRDGWLARVERVRNIALALDKQAGGVV